MIKTRSAHEIGTKVLGWRSRLLALGALTTLAALSVAAVTALNGGSEPFGNSFAPVVDAQDEETLTVRIIARRAPDGRIEFGMRPPVGDDILPRARYIAARGPAHDRWLRSTEIDFGDGFVGRIIARREAGNPNGRVEFGFRVEGYDDLFPRQRFFPGSGPDHHRWLRSSEIDLRRPRSDNAQTAAAGTVRGDGASITIPRGAADSDARVTVRKVAPEAAPPLPDFADDYGEVFDFEVEGGIRGEVEVRVPAPDDEDANYVVVHYENGTWNPEPFELDGDQIVVRTDSLSLIGWLQLGIVKAIEHMETLIDFNLDLLKQIIKPEGPDLCRTEADDVEVVEEGRRKFKTGGILGFGGQEVYALAGCAEPASGGSMLRVKNRVTIWLDLFPGIEQPGFQPRHSSVGEVLGWFSVHDDGTLLGPGWETQWFVADGNSGVLQAEPTGWSYVITALMTIPDALSAAVGDLGDDLKSTRDAIKAFVEQVQKARIYTQLLSNVEQELQRGDNRTSLEVLTAIAGHIYPVFHNELLGNEALKNAFHRVVDKLALKLGVKLSSKAALAWLAKLTVVQRYVQLVGHIIEDVWAQFTDRYRALGTVRADPIQDPSDSEDDAVQVTPTYIETLSAGSYHTCALTTAGAVQCWGSDSNGQSSPLAGRFSQVSVGWPHTCGLTAAGAVQCWGSDSNGGQLSPPTGRFTQVSAGLLHTCGLTAAGAVQCWGGGSGGQPSPPAGRFTQVSAGVNHTCGLTAAGAVQCWGDDEYGQLSSPDGRFTQVSAGFRHTCGLTAAGAVQCWGDDEYGQSSSPDGRFTQISAGVNHTCGLTAAGAVQCWGDDEYGQSSSPDGRFTQVSAGGIHTCGLTAAGAVQCWGSNDHGQRDPVPEFGGPPGPRYRLEIGRRGGEALGYFCLPCGGGQYVAGTMVTVEARGSYWRDGEQIDAEFLRWEGDLSGSENPTTITMDRDKTIIAVFRPLDDE